MDTKTTAGAVNGYHHHRPNLTTPIRPVAHIMREQVKLRVKEIVSTMRGADAGAGPKAYDEAVSALTELALAGGAPTSFTNRLLER